MELTKAIPTFTKEIIQQLIQQNSARLHLLGVKEIGLFGSYVRGEQNSDSDIDILVDFQENQETFDHFMDVCWLLDELFPEHKVEVVSTEALSPHIGPHILKTVEYVKIAN